eukprot:COSAG02_NODE_333_length_24452_cov_12.756703_14_plen_112_part_00
MGNECVRHLGGATFSLVNIALGTGIGCGEECSTASIEFPCVSNHSYSNKPISPERPEPLTVPYVGALEGQKGKGKGKGSNVWIVLSDCTLPFCCAATAKLAGLLVVRSPLR